MGHSAVLGLQADLAVVGNRFYWVVTIVLVTQLAWLPFSSFFIVRASPRLLLSVMVLGWGVVQACTSAANSFGGLLAARAALGIFEAGCLPLFAMVTGAWYRRAEQPLRIAVWYGTNGLATVIAPLLSNAFGKIQSPRLAPWRM